MVLSCIAWMSFFIKSNYLTEFPTILDCLSTASILSVLYCSLSSSGLRLCSSALIPIISPLTSFTAASTDYLTPDSIFSSLLLISLAVYLILKLSACSTLYLSLKASTFFKWLMIIWKFCVSFSSMLPKSNKGVIPLRCKPSKFIIILLAWHILFNMRILWKVLIIIIIVAGVDADCSQAERCPCLESSDTLLCTSTSCKSLFTPSGSLSYNHLVFTSDQGCKPCSYSCRICLSETLCAYCENEYHLVNGTCRSCDIINCLVCNNESCLACLEGYFLDQKTGLC